MNAKERQRAALQSRLRRLARTLGRTGFLTQGSVFARKAPGSGSRYQWTWKDANQKTTSLTLSPQQFLWLKKAIAQSRTVEKTLRKMRAISHQIYKGVRPGYCKVLKDFFNISGWVMRGFFRKS